ncbi:aspartate aminotransferase family protein [Candidatus Poriferisodalis sp.]|uniref:aspartate aminotransferase family protein n=1 Tax=Candidatus Poriferisodalis sp. TaxID=3101277 RepID=UPI003B022A52
MTDLADAPAAAAQTTVQMTESGPWPTEASAALYERAQQSITDGTSRATLLRKGHPIYVDHGEGAWVTDVDGNRYLDCNNNFASIVVGHADPVIAAAVGARMARGTAFSLPNDAEIELAELLCGRVESFDLIRFCNSGTEAVMGALKAARAYTGRPNVIKVEGAYHGTYDHAEASQSPDPTNWGDAGAPSTVPYAVGTPASVEDEVGIISFNDAEGARAAIRRGGDRLAAVLLDVMPNRVGMPAIEPEFIAAIRETTREVGALFVLDEVISFRLGYGGAQTKLGIDPDITSLAKIIGGGFPVGAIAGRRGPMETFTRVAGDRAKVPSSGTFAANPITMTAGHAAMTQLDPAAFARLDAIGEAIRSGLRSLFEAADLKWQVTGAGSLFRVHPHTRTIRNYRDSHLSSDEATEVTHFGLRMQAHGVYFIAESLGCLNLATTDDDVEHFLAAAHASLPSP